MQLQKHVVLSDPFTQNYCLDCTRPVNEQGKVQYERYTIPANFDPTAFDPSNPDAPQDGAPHPEMTPTPQ